MKCGGRLAWATLACGAFVCAWLPGHVSAQTAPVCTSDTAGTMKTELFIVHLMPIDAHSGRAATDDSVGMALGREIALEYEHPASASNNLRNWIHLLSDTATAVSASGIVEMFFNTSGALTRVTWVYSSPLPSVDSAVGAAIRRADSSGAFAGIPALRSGSRAMEVALTKGQAGVILPLFQARVRHFDAEPPQLRQLRLPEPPRDLRDAGKRAWTEWEFIVGTDGRPEPESLRLIGESVPPFEALRSLARTALLRAEYTPGRSGGCSIRMPARYRMGFRTEVPKF